MSKSKANVYKIKEMIENNNVTKEDIKRTLGIKATSLATNYTYLRFMGCCPITNEDGFEVFVTPEEYEQIKAEKKAKAAERKTTSKKTPQERYDAAVKRLGRTKTALDKAELNAANDSDSEILGYRLDKAKAEFNIASYDVRALKEEFGEELQTETVVDEIEAEEVDEAVSEAGDDLV